MSDGSNVVSLLNNYELWRLETKQSTNKDNREIFSFEVWLNTVEDKISLFDSLKPYVDEYGEYIDWHECTHDEVVSLPCIIVESYRGE